MANRKYSRLLHLALAFLFAAAVLLFYSWFARARPSIDNVSQVSIGMTQSEVACLLGDPTYEVSHREVNLSGDSDNPVGAAIGFSLFGTDDRGYWEYQLDDDGMLAPATQVQDEEDFLASGLAKALFSRPDGTSIVIYFGSRGTVDEIQLPSQIGNSMLEIHKN